MLNVTPSRKNAALWLLFLSNVEIFTEFEKVKAKYYCFYNLVFCDDFCNIGLLETSVFLVNLQNLEMVA